MVVREMVIMVGFLMVDIVTKVLFFANENDLDNALVFQLQKYYELSYYITAANSRISDTLLQPLRKVVRLKKAFAPQGLLIVRRQPYVRKHKGEIGYLCAAAGVPANKRPGLRKAF